MKASEIPVDEKWIYKWYLQSYFDLIQRDSENVSVWQVVLICVRFCKFV